MQSQFYPTSWSHQLGLLREAIQGLSSGVERCVGLNKHGDPPSDQHSSALPAIDRSTRNKSFASCLTCVTFLILYRLQRPADAWLQQFSASPGSWRLCLRLLETPDVQLNECFYAANSLRTVCLNHQVGGAQSMQALQRGIAVHRSATVYGVQTQGQPFSPCWLLRCIPHKMLCKLEVP
jgi:hypothetical protein